jgi:thiamine-phosphate pyrophosphorylase
MPKVTADELQKLLKVYFIMGSVNCKKNPLDVLEEAIAGGITIFQYREKGTGALTGEDKLKLGKELQKICQKHQIPFIVNDDVDLALKLDADGVHIGQEDESAEIVRQKIGDKILGVSAHTFEEAERAIAQGADYIGVGPIFSTKTKEDAKKAQGPQIISSMRNQGIAIPIVGIGGINSENAGQVVANGADGVAVISAISYADDVKKSAAKLKQTVESFF